MSHFNFVEVYFKLKILRLLLSVYHYFSKLKEKNIRRPFLPPKVTDRKCFRTVVYDIHSALKCHTYQPGCTCLQLFLLISSEVAGMLWSPLLCRGHSLAYSLQNLSFVLVLSEVLERHRRCSPQPIVLYKGKRKFFE